MLDPVRPFFDHSRHQLSVRGCDAPLDVLAFEGKEGLSRPFSYRIEFTSSARDIAADAMLGQRASFSLYAAPEWPPRFYFEPPKITPLRTLHGVITAFKRLSASRDEARYEVTLQPRLALLGRGVQYRIFQDQSVPEIVEQVLRAAPHGFRGQDFVFNLSREYPRLDQVMQYGETNLAFVQRTLAASGLWYRLTTDERLGIEVMEIGDSRQQYEYGHSLPLRAQSGLQSNAADSVWNLQASHEVVEAGVFARAYNPREAWADLDAKVDLTRGARTVYGEAYHYNQPHTKPGDAFAFDHQQRSDEGFFQARLAHERYLNRQTRLSGTSSSALLAPGQVLTIEGAPQAFEKGALIVGMTCTAARDSSFVVDFEAIPKTDHYSFRPPLPKKPSIAGTVPARVTSTRKNDPYGHIDKEGRYKVNFLFDRDSWPAGQESAWLRLARPYAGDTHGLHLPLLAGTEVAVAFEQGDPDKPYIAHALHDSRNPDPVTLYNYKRNVLRTPANNKLRMDDERGKEHVKLSTEHSGKSQLNLGHLVDNQKQPRGEGFELRTDGHGAIRAGKGLFISADGQPRAQGSMLEMSSAMEQINQALELAQRLMRDATQADALPADTTQPEQLKDTLNQLRDAGLLVSAPAGIALTTPGNLQHAAGNNLIAVAGGNADTSVLKRFTVAAGGAISLFAKKLGLKFIANAGPVTLQAQNDVMQLLARQELEITSTEDEIHITAKKKIVLNGGGSYLSLSPAAVELGSGDFKIRARLNQKGAASRAATFPSVPSLISAQNAPGQDPFEPLDLEEEEEEEELDGIVLRLGLFFDGTGNNLANAAAVAQCQRDDLAQFGEEELAAITRQCAGYGYGQFDGESFASTPDSSYGNAPSNVAHLYDLYPDNATVPITEGADIGYAKVYLDGIGTRSGGQDSIYGQITGRGETGVVARVEQAPTLIREQLDTFQKTNPGIRVRAVEFDLFGFSRGAAAARHCANELLKSGRGVFGDLLRPGRFGLATAFDPAKQVRLNLIGLFDSVAGIVDLRHGDSGPDNADNPGVNLYLPANCARHVIQLRARDEQRLNFALNSVQPQHREISLPGVHSDVGGGYLPQGREHLLLTQPRRFVVTGRQAPTDHPTWQQTQAQVTVLQANGVAGSGRIETQHWPIPKPPRGDRDDGDRHYLVAGVLDRPVRGELAQVALRLMRELGVRHGVPFDVISNEDKRFKLPEDLQAIAVTILEQALTATEVELTPEQERLLRGRYIHQSAHWSPVAGVLVNKPTENGVRNVYPNQPQPGYPV